MRDIKSKEKEAENFNDQQYSFSFWAKPKKERKDDKDIYQAGDKSGSYLLPPPDSVLPNLHMEPYTKYVVIGGSKAVNDGKDFVVRESVTKKVIVKDLLQTLNEDPCHRHKPLVYRLSNNLQ